MKRTSICHKYKTFIALAVSGVHKRIDSIHISLNEIHTGSKKRACQHFSDQVSVITKELLSQKEHLTTNLTYTRKAIQY